MSKEAMKEAADRIIDALVAAKTVKNFTPEVCEATRGMITAEIERATLNLRMDMVRFVQWWGDKAHRRGAGQHGLSPSPDWRRCNDSLCVSLAKSIEDMTAGAPVVTFSQVPPTIVSVSKSGPAPQGGEWVSPAGWVGGVDPAAGRDRAVTAEFEWKEVPRAELRHGRLDGKVKLFHGEVPIADSVEYGGGRRAYEMTDENYRLGFGGGILRRTLKSKNGVPVNEQPGESGTVSRTG